MITNTLHIDKIKKSIDRLQRQYNGFLVVSCGSYCEGDFSWHPCEICNTHLGGNRHQAAMINQGEGKEPFTLSICECCLVYLANNDECNCKE